MITIRVDQNENDTKAIIKALENLKPDDKNSPVYRGLVSASSFMKKKLSDNIRGKYLKRRTGDLSRSLGFVVGRDGDSLTGWVGSGVLTGRRMRYANILETGGTIRATNKMLTVPLRKALTPSGRLKFTAPMVRDGHSAYVGSFVRRGKSGSPIIYGKKANGTVDALFVLKTSVRIPAKRWMSRTVDEYKGQAYERLVETMRKAIKV